LVVEEARRPLDLVADGVGDVVGANDAGNDRYDVSGPGLAVGPPESEEFHFHLSFVGAPGL
jgi:hypothetical protein